MLTWSKGATGLSVDGVPEHVLLIARGFLAKLQSPLVCFKKPG